MADLLISFASVVVATFVPLYFGLLVPHVLGWQPNRSVFFLAASSGIIFWFFLDVMGDSALLDVNQGFGGNYTHVVLAGTFALGVLLLFGLERRFSSSPTQEMGAGSPTTPEWTQVTFAISLIAALGIGFHSLGEGIDIGSVVPGASSIIGAIGGISPGLAYAIHKFLEGFVLGAFALLARSNYRQIGILGIVSGVPTVIGFFIGLPSVLESTYFFALGGAGAVYIELKLVPLFIKRRSAFASIVYFLLGFYFMYIAGLFHS